MYLLIVIITRTEENTERTLFKWFYAFKLRRVHVRLTARDILIFMYQKNTDIVALYPVTVTGLFI